MKNNSLYVVVAVAGAFLASACSLPQDIGRTDANIQPAPDAPAPSWPECQGDCQMVKLQLAAAAAKIQGGRYDFSTRTIVADGPDVVTAHIAVPVLEHGCVASIQATEIPGDNSTLTLFYQEENGGGADFIVAQSRNGPSDGWIRSLTPVAPAHKITDETAYTLEWRSDGGTGRLEQVQIVFWQGC